MKRWKIILPSLIATTSLPLVSLVGCGQQSEQVVGGQTILYGSDDETQGMDTSSWNLKKGKIILPAELSVVGPDKNSVTIDDGGYIHWGDLDQGIYRFNVQAVFEGKKFKSEDIKLCIGPKTTAFENDSWSVVGWLANQGIDMLHAAYKDDCERNVRYPGTLIGLTKKVKLNGLDHIVRVVDENQGSFDYDEKTNKFANNASLTFQFQNLISWEGVAGGADAGTYLQIEWETDFMEQGSKNYWISSLHNALEGNYPVFWQDATGTDVADASKQISVLQMIKKDNNDGLDTYIRSVYRNVHTYDIKIGDKPLWYLTSRPSKIFCPFLSNIFSVKGIKNSNKSVIPSLYWDLYCEEGQQFAYYKNPLVVGDQPITDSDGQSRFFGLLAFKDVAGSGETPGSSNYWLSTPKMDTPAGIWNFGGDGKLYGNGVNDFIALAPCFCI